MGEVNGDDDVEDDDDHDDYDYVADGVEDNDSDINDARAKR
jgi:hypothetical protein